MFCGSAGTNSFMLSIKVLKGMKKDRKSYELLLSFFIPYLLKNIYFFM